MHKSTFCTLFSSQAPAYYNLNADECNKDALHACRQALKPPSDEHLLSIKGQTEPNVLAGTISRDRSRESSGASRCGTADVSKRQIIRAFMRQVRWACSDFGNSKWPYAGTMQHRSRACQQCRSADRQ